MSCFRATKYQLVLSPAAASPGSQTQSAGGSGDVAQRTHRTHHRGGWAEDLEEPSEQDSGPGRLWGLPVRQPASRGQGHGVSSNVVTTLTSHYIIVASSLLSFVYSDSFIEDLDILRTRRMNFSLPCEVVVLCLFPDHALIISFL